MRSNYDFSPKTEVLLTTNSNVQFVILGPVGGRDRILAKSSDCTIELIGQAINRDYPSIDEPEKYIGSSGSFISSLLLGKGLNTHVITSDRLPDLRPDLDSRSSRVIFAWQGYCSTVGKKRIKSLLRLTSTDMYSAILENDVRAMELSIAPLVRICAIENERFLARRRFLYVAVVLYGIIGLSFFVAILTTQFYRNLTG